MHSSSTPSLSRARLAGRTLSLLALAWLVTVPRPAEAAVFANAGPDGAPLVGQLVTLDGSASTGPVTQYAWRFLSRPSGSRAAISGATAVTASFVPDRNGTYVVRLTVRGGGSTSTDSATFITVNEPPVANAGADVSRVVGTRVALDGRLSSDPDGDKLTYSWVVASGPAHSRRAVINPTAVRPGVVLDRPGTYVVELTVSDGRRSSVPDQVVLTTLNTKPVADAGRDQAIAVGVPVTVDGGRSYDVDEQALTYAWTLRRPARSLASLSDPRSVRPTFVPDVAGTYTATLVVSDGSLTHSDAALLTTANLKPVAQAPAGGQGLVGGGAVQLDGTTSFDANGNPITYVWTLTRPAGSLATISDPSAPRPTLTADVAGKYTASLVVRDSLAVLSAKVSSVFVNGNKPPLATAGPDQAVPVGDMVTLAESGSSDPDGNTLSYGWAFVSKPAGSAASLSAAADVNATFEPDEAGTYVLQLIVFDGTALSRADTVVISTTGNTPPVADAGTDRALAPGIPVTLDGSGSSDADSDSLTYQWALVARPPASSALLTLANTAAPVLSPDIPGDYVVQLVVSDGFAASNVDTVVLSTSNVRPVARAGIDSTVLVDDPVTLDGSASFDPNHDPLTYSWLFVTMPAGSASALDDPSSVTPQFMPDRPGVYVLQLVVQDAEGPSLPDSVAVTVAVTGNRPPVALAGPDQLITVPPDVTVQLDGRESFDPDGCPGSPGPKDCLTYQWIFNVWPGQSDPSKPVLTGETTATPTFIATSDGLYVLQLRVSDGVLLSATDIVRIKTSNTAPLVHAGEDQSNVALGTLVDLTGSASDVDGDLLSYEWSFVQKPSGSTAVLAPADSITSTFLLDQPGRYVAQLTVSDGFLSATDTVQVTTPNSAPTANAGPDRLGTVDVPIIINGSGMDVDGDPLTYRWTILSSPPGSAAALVNENTPSPTLNPDRGGHYTLRLIVNDGFVDSAPDDMVVNATAGNILLSLSPGGLLGVGRTTTLHIALTAPAPAGGLVVALSSAPTGVVSLTPTSVTIPGGGTAGSATIGALTVGTTVVSATAAGYEPSTITVVVTNELITLGAGISAPVGFVSPLPVSIGPSPAGPFGVSVTLVADPAALQLVSSSVTIPAGEFSANASIVGLRGGPVTVSAKSPAHASATTVVIITGELQILESAVTFSPGLPRSIRVQLQSAGSAIVVPSPGLTVSLAAADPACVTVPATLVISAGQTLRKQALAYGGSASLPCTTTVTASAPGLTSDAVPVTVNPPPPITFLGSFPRKIGAGLQEGTYVAQLGTGEHDTLLVRITSNDPTRLRVAPDATTSGSAHIDVEVAEGAVNAAFYVQGVEGHTGDVTVEATAPGFVTGTSGTFSVVPPALSFHGTVPGVIASLAPDTPFQVFVGAALDDNSGLESLQAVRAGAPARTVTVTSSQPSAAQLRILAGLTTSAEVTVPSGSDRTANTVATGGVALDPVAGGATTILASIPGFTATAGASQVVNVVGQGIAIYSPYPFPFIQSFPRYVGGGLQDGPFWIRLEASNHGGVRVVVQSNSPGTLLVSPDAATAGTPSIELAVADGQTDASFYVQGLEEQAGDVTVTASAPGFAPSTSGLVKVVPPGVTLFGSLPGTTTSLSSDTPFRVLIGPAAADGSDLIPQGPFGHGVEQAIRAGGTDRTLTLTNSNAPVADLKTQGGTGDVVTLTIPVGAASTPETVDAGGAAFDPVSDGTTTVSAEIAGFVSTQRASQEVTVGGAGMAIYTPYTYPVIQEFPRYVGAGLQDGPYWAVLGGSEHDGVVVQIVSNDPTKLLVSPDAATPGTPSIGLLLGPGQTTVSFYVQGVEGRSGNVTLSASAPGFTPTTSGALSVVAPGVSLLGTLPATTSALSADSPFVASVGPALPDASGLYYQYYTGYVQAIRAGGVDRTLSVTSDTPSVGLVKTLAGSGSSVELTFPVGAGQTPYYVESGGVAFDPVALGTTTVTASIPGFVTTAGASQEVTVTATGMAIYTPYIYPVIQEFPRYVGAGLQDGPYWVVLGGSSHGGVTIRVASGDPALLLVSPDAATSGTAFIDLPVLDGQTTASFYIQGIDGHTGGTSVTAAAPGFTGTVSGVINVVTPAVSLLGSLPGSTTSASIGTPFYAYLGVPSDDSTTLRSHYGPSYLQAVRAGGSAKTVTVTSSTPSVGLIRAGAVTSASVTATILPGAAHTDYAALQFVPAGPGATTVSATIPGFIPVDDASRLVNVDEPVITVYSPYYYPVLQSFPRYVGAGLQDGPYWIGLGGSAHGGITIRIASSHPTRALIAPDAATVGTPFIDVLVPDGQTAANFFVQGLEGASGNITVTATGPGFVGGTSGTITVAPPAYRLIGLPASVGATDETFMFHVELGVPTPGNTDLVFQDWSGYQQALRAGATPLDVTVTNDNPVASQLVSTLGGGQSFTVAIQAGQAATPNTVLDGGIAFDALSGACTEAGCDTFVEATITGLIKTQVATRVVKVTP